MVGCTQEQIYFGRIQDSDEDILEAILRTFDAAPKYNPNLLQSDTDSEAGSTQQVGQWMNLSSLVACSLAMQDQGLGVVLQKRCLCAMHMTVLL